MMECMRLEPSLRPTVRLICARPCVDPCLHWVLPAACIAVCRSMHTLAVAGTCSHCCMRACPLAASRPCKLCGGWKAGGAGLKSRLWMCPFAPQPHRPPQRQAPQRIKVAAASLTARSETESAVEAATY